MAKLRATVDFKKCSAADLIKANAKPAALEFVGQAISGSPEFIGRKLAAAGVPEIFLKTLEEAREKVEGPGFLKSLIASFGSGGPCISNAHSAAIPLDRPCKEAEIPVDGFDATVLITRCL